MPGRLTKSQLSDTEPWIRNKADELAVDNGCWFSPVRAAYMVWWVERYCRLYEGEGFAGQPCIMPSVYDQPADWNEIPEMFPQFYDENGVPLEPVMEFYRARMEWHNDLYHSGTFMHWQFECHARIYGWVREADDRWKARGLEIVRRFRKARVWIPKKSGKTPSLGFNTCYLTFGDGEPGGKTFIAAKDGKQAGRVWDHAHMMVQSSPELHAACEVNRTTKVVRHLDSHSHFEPLSSSNKRTKDSKEGLNGNVVVDETHVVDREFMSILRYAGASRPQPLDLAFSTAGNNPESFGKSEWDRGEKINEGKLQIDNYFHASYHAPQDLTVEKMNADPEKYIRMANPALGHTVGMEELLPAWHESKDDPMQAAEYFMYRLNIWMNASQTWLGPGVWSGCVVDRFDEKRLLNSPMVIGLDLARKFDMAAAALSWKNDLGGVDQRWLFWCNEDRIKTIGIKYPEIIKWADAGFIKTTPGNVTDLRQVKRDLRDVCKRYKTVGIVYDATYAETIVQDLVDGEPDERGGWIHPPLPIGEQAMNQGRMTQTGPVADFENDLKERKFRHEDNPVASWQFSHATVSEDKRGHRMVVKESRSSYRTVDGCQASIMSRWGALDFTEWEYKSFDFYVHNDVEFV